MSDDAPQDTLPPSIARVLARFRAMAREDKMQALVHYSKKLEPLPERLRELDRGQFTVPECQTRVDLFSEYRDGVMHYYADLDVRQSPTIAAFLAIVFSAINGQPPSTTLAIPDDFVHQLMEGIGLSGREVGLTAMVARIKQSAASSIERRVVSEPAARPGTEGELDDLLSVPRAETFAALAQCPGDVIVLGAGGKMGPTLARMAVRASTAAGGTRRVLAVSRWSSGDAERALNAAGVETIRCDLLDRSAVARLPDAPNVIFMAGQKFGTSGAPAATWAMNVLVPAHCAERYASARIVAFSTGNVYALSPAHSAGAREDDALGPVGEYATSCVGRERVFEWYAARDGTRVAIVRLNYAIDLRYGVLVDVALKVKRGEPVPLAMGYVNVIWQGDANRIALECLPHASSPPFVVNVTGAERLSVRALAERFGERFGRAPRFADNEGPDALLSDTSRMQALFALPATTVDTMIDLVARWIESGGPLLDKPTKFEARDGRF
jgi:nucleoside-diphosphate-sugar epimerase/sulfur transfer protein SufE